MSSIVPHIFVVLSAAALSLALFSLWQSLRVLFLRGEGVYPVGERDGHPSSDTVTLERRSIDQRMEDIRFERDMGRLSEQDFNSLDRDLKERDGAISESVEQSLRSAREEAQKLIAERLMQVSNKTIDPNGRPSETTNQCRQCRTENDLDAVYCKKCGNRLDHEVKP
jgi:hypothetical protein